MLQARQSRILMEKQLGSEKELTTLRLNHERRERVRQSQVDAAFAAVEALENLRWTVDQILLAPLTCRWWGGDHGWIIIDEHPPPAVADATAEVDRSLRIVPEAIRSKAKEVQSAIDSLHETINAKRVRKAREAHKSRGDGVHGDEFTVQLEHSLIGDFSDTLRARVGALVLDDTNVEDGVFAHVQAVVEATESLRKLVREFALEVELTPLHGESDRFA
jgi:hypothetical protein